MELGEIRQLQNKPLEAIEAYSEATHFTKFLDRAVAAQKVAEIYLGMGITDEAAKFAKLAHDLRPYDPQITQLQAKIAKAAGK